MHDSIAMLTHRDFYSLKGDSIEHRGRSGINRFSFWTFTHVLYGR